MEDFHFAQPAYLSGLLALPVLAWILSRLGKNAHQRLLAFVSATNLTQLLKDHGGAASKVKPWLFWLGLACLVIAMARPQANPEIEERQGSSLDIYVLLDVSRSMDAEDVAPSRLKKAKREIQTLMNNLSGDRVGLIAFAGSAIIVSPLTSDYEVMRTFLQNVDTSLIQNQTTDINAALTVAEGAMARGAERTGKDGPRSNVFIIMSDGEDQEQAGNYSAVERIHANGGTVFTIAFGTEEGGKIPARNAAGELLGYKRDRANGGEVVTKVTPKSLQEIAKLGGGQFYFSTLDEGEIRDILNRMQGFQRSNAAVMKARIYQEYFWPVLAAGAVMILLSFFTRRISFRALSVGAKSGAVLFVVLSSASAHASVLSFLWDKDRRASEESQKLAQEGKTDEAVDKLKNLLAEDPDSAALNYNVGTYLLEGKKGDQGREQLQRLQKTPGVLHDGALFNTAGSFASEGKKDEARASYAELISELSSKPSLTKQEQDLLTLAKKNVSRLADPEQQPKQNQQNQQQNQDQKKSSGQDQKQDPKDQKDQKGQQDQKDQKDQKQDPKDQKGDDKKDQKPEDKKKDEEKKGNDKKPEDQKSEEQKKEEKEGKEKQNSQLPQHGRQPFKEQQSLTEDDAKRLMEQLKLDETGLQKKFLRKKEDGVKQNENAKDW